MQACAICTSITCIGWVSPAGGNGLHRTHTTPGNRNKAEACNGCHASMHMVRRPACRRITVSAAFAFALAMTPCRLLCPCLTGRSASGRLLRLHLGSCAPMSGRWCCQLKCQTGWPGACWQRAAGSAGGPRGGSRWGHRGSKVCQPYRAGYFQGAQAVLSMEQLCRGSACACVIQWICLHV